MIASKSIEPYVVARFAKDTSEDGWLKQFFAKVSTPTLTLDRVIDSYLVDFEKQDVRSQDDVTDENGDLIEKAPANGWVLKRKPAKHSLLVQRCIQPLSTHDASQFDDFEFADGTKLGDGRTINNFQRLNLTYQEAGNWLMRDYFTPGNVDARAVCEALAEFPVDGSKKKLSLDSERWRQIMRLIIGWQSILLVTQPIILASCIRQTNKTIENYNAADGQERL